MAGTITPRKNHLLVRDIHLPQRTASGLHLPDPSTSHGGTIQSARDYAIAMVIAQGKMDKYHNDSPTNGSVVLILNVAGKRHEVESETATFRFIHADEVLAEIDDYDPADALKFI